MVSSHSPIPPSNATVLQVLLFALEEESAIKRVSSDDWVQMAESNDLQICLHVIQAGVLPAIHPVLLPGNTATAEVRSQIKAATAT